jgi:hypothetical protein
MEGWISYGLGLRLSCHELLPEGIPVTIFAGFLDNDLFVVVRQLVDDVLDLLVELKLVELRDALLCDRHSADRVLAYI